MQVHKLNIAIIWVDLKIVIQVNIKHQNIGRFKTGQFIIRNQDMDRAQNQEVK